MKLIILALVIVLAVGSTALAAWPYGAPAVVPAPTVVHSFYPVGPVYAYPPPVVSVPARVVYRAPVVSVPRRVVYRAPIVYPAPTIVYRRSIVAPAPIAVPVVVRSKVFVRGQPVRNAVRAVLP